MGYGPYAPGDFRSLAAAGAPVEVMGKPPGGANAEEVVASLRMPNRLSQTPMQVAQTPGEGARLVFAFGVSGGVGGSMLCRGDAAGASFQDRLEVAAAYCRGERMHSEARLSLDQPVGPSDPQFRAFDAAADFDARPALQSQSRQGQSAAVPLSLELRRRRTGRRSAERGKSPSVS